MKKTIFALFAFVGLASGIAEANMKMKKYGYRTMWGMGPSVSYSTKGTGTTLFGIASHKIRKFTTGKKKGMHSFMRSGLYYDMSGNGTFYMNGSYGRRKMVAKNMYADIGMYVRKSCLLTQSRGFISCGGTGAEDYEYGPSISFSWDKGRGFFASLTIEHDARESLTAKNITLDHIRFLVSAGMHMARRTVNASARKMMSW